MTDRKPLPGKFVWFEHASKDPKKAQLFYAEVFGWKVQPFPMGADSYDMILAGDTPDTMLGGYASLESGRTPHWISYVSVNDVDAAVKAAAANGGKIVEPPTDIPTVGRYARIADPQGAEICVFRNSTGDPPDAPSGVPSGRFLWNELHTTDPAKALAFYEKVVGFTSRTMDMGPAGKYHVIGKGGADRGGVTNELAPGAKPHWLPYVSVDDTDATVARAKKFGAKIAMPATDIPGVGRFAVFDDPTGAQLAVLKPQPAQKKG
jgi:predicted enzyme related to lactoylglutathione lyase